MESSQLFKMADETKSSAVSQSQGSFLYKDDLDVAKTNIVNFGDSNNMNTVSSGSFQGTTMTVPERIVLDGSFDSKESNNLERDLKGNGVDFQTCMGGMATPPRTLTVDDTSFFEKSGREGENTLKNAEELYAAGGENRMFQKSSNSEANSHLLNEIARLDKRVSYLEMQLETKQSNSKWRTTLFCLLTILNPLLIHWLFSKRRF